MRKFFFFSEELYNITFVVLDKSFYKQIVSAVSFCLVYGEKLFVNFPFFIRKFIIFIVLLRHTRNIGFLLLKIVIFMIFVAHFTF